MRIWIDGDACPRVIKDVLYRAAMRTQTPLIIVANQPLTVPASIWIKKCQVGFGFDVVDHYIVEHLAAGDLVITADVPFADAVITQGGLALNPRGELYSTDNIKQHLAVRNMNESLRSFQTQSTGPACFSARNVQDFANNLDRILAKYTKKGF